ncbi:hypothetical protein [Chryseobacterium sp. MFBS3-17]|uniref:hypothetical protein n=1 Tax=Chryseobacterium sp. MFBS3-17 TaxID=2886689 RepID=UPI001D0F08C8|nr:hypothetical protein [Chryseobacterium sp. MFBS3-17]MCC2589556.1 hypothetical protein [Chryseobacterium sp. MFBS3-17]
MKKLLFGLAITIGTLSFAQYQNSGWGNSSYNNQYGYYDDDYYFPDDYYYDYPSDYYADSYYQSYYNDYRNSIVMVNWNDFFRMHRLNRWQVQEIIKLNRMFASYASWNSYYRYNPDRWYFDRFYALRQIMGPQIFIVFQNNYYNGYHPVVYFQNYRREYYVPRYKVANRYRNVNINIYKIDRNRFVEKHGNQYGWNSNRNPHNPGGFKEDSGRRSGTGSYSNPASTSVRSNNTASQSTGVRSESATGTRSSSSSTRAVTTPSRTQTQSGNTRANTGTRSTSSVSSQPRSTASSTRSTTVRSNENSSRSNSQSTRSSSGSGSRGGGGMR